MVNRPSTSEQAHGAVHRRRKMKNREKVIEPVLVAVLGGDPVVGHTLKLMVESSGHEARFLAEPILEKLEDLSGAGLFLLAPALSVGEREAFFSVRAGEPESVSAPVIELVPATGKARETGAKALIWPCGTGELESAMDAVLSGLSDGALTESA